MLARSTARLTTPSTWREAEEATFALLEDLLEGRLPDLDRCLLEEARRIGYLAEVALLLLEPRDASALNDLVHEARSRTSGLGQTTIAAVAWPRSRPHPRGLDEIADLWNISPGIDLGRFRAETVATPAVNRR